MVLCLGVTGLLVFLWALKSILPRKPQQRHTYLSICKTFTRYTRVHIIDWMNIISDKAIVKRMKHSGCRRLLQSYKVLRVFGQTVFWSWVIYRSTAIEFTVATRRIQNFMLFGSKHFTCALNFGFIYRQA